MRFAFAYLSVYCERRQLKFMPSRLSEIRVWQVVSKPIGPPVLTPEAVEVETFFCLVSIGIKFKIFKKILYF